MNREDIKKAFDQFILSKEFRVAALAGSWGVGKTHLWWDYSQMLRGQRKTPGSVTLPETFTGLAYASLFGATSVDDLRRHVAEGMVLTQTRDEMLARYKKNIESSLITALIPDIRNWWSGLPAWLRIMRRIKDDGLMGLIGASGYWFVRDALVALDDLERCPGIDLVTIMGFVDELRNRGCKVVLITNRDKLNEEEQRRYWEKVVDCDLKLDPDAEENSKIVFGAAFTPAEFAEHARATLKALRCNNIRIHKRAAWLIREIEPRMEGLAIDVRKQAVVNATVLCWVLLEPADRIPIDIVVQPEHSQLWAELANDEELNEAEKRWRSIARETDFSPLEFDQYFVSLISTGWCDKNALATALQKVNSEVDKQRASERVRESIFRSYTNDFKMSRQQYIERVRNVLSEEVDRLYVHEFGTSLAHLRACGGDPGDLAQLFIERRGEHLDLVARAQERQPIEDTTLEAEVKQRETAYLATRFTIDEVAHDIITRDGWGQDQIQYLAERSVDEYETWLLSDPTNLSRKLKGLLRFRTIGLGEPYPAIAASVTEALRRLARRNDFDRDRIAHAYGVTLENEGQDHAG